jgi:hypothetical protein
MTIVDISYDAGGGFIFNHCNPCTGSQTVYGITFAASGANVTISGTPTQAGVAIIFQLRATAGSSCDRTYRLELIRKPLDLSVILDRSGSMASAYDGSFNPPPGQRRWDGLLTGVGILRTQLGMSTLLGGDALGLRLFASNVVTPAAPFNAGVVNMQTNLNQLGAVVSGETPNGSTALGDGIISGRNMILPGTANSSKAMIVFSDGVQNAGDQVQVSGSNQFTHTNSNQKLSGPANEIKIHTICLGSSGHNPLLMSEIANHNGPGQYLNTTAGAPADFSTFFSAHLNNILAGSSPQYVDIRKADFPVPTGPTPSQSQQSFIVNKGVNAVIVTLLVPTRHEPHFTSFVKDGTDLIQHAQKSSGPGFISIALRYPIQALPGTTLNGDWTVSAALAGIPKAPVPYTLMIVVDDHVIQPGYKLGPGSLKVNDVLSLTATLNRAGDSVSNAQVQAIVGKPGDDINDLIARATVAFGTDPNDPGSPDAAKLAVLLQDPAFLAKIKAQDQVVALSYNAAEKSYQGTFSGLDVAGVYQVVYRVTVDDAVVGKVRRYHLQSFYVRFPDVDLPNSGMSMTQGPGGNTVVSIRPQASNGRLIGSGWGPAIRLDAPNASITNIADQGDGRYTITLTGTLTGSGKLSIANEPIFEGNLSNLNCYSSGLNLIRRIQCWLIRLGLPGWLLWLLLLLLLILLILILR